jgi:hypothetical protein
MALEIHFGAKIEELTPQLLMKSDIEFNFIDKLTVREQDKESFKHNPTLVPSDAYGMKGESDDEDEIQYRKVLPRETFDPLNP